MASLFPKADDENSPCIDQLLITRSDMEPTWSEMSDFVTTRIHSKSKATTDLLNVPPVCSMSKGSLVTYRMPWKVPPTSVIKAGHLRNSSVIQATRFSDSPSGPPAYLDV